MTYNDMSEEVKIVLDFYTGRLFVEFSDGSWKPIMADKNGGVYVEVDDGT